MVLYACGLRLDRVSELLYDDSGKAGTLVRVKGCWNDEGLLKVAHLRESAACANPGFRPRIGVRGGLCVGMTKVQFMDNGKALPKRPYGHRVVRGCEKVFSKNLPLGPLGPPSKL